MKPSVIFIRHGESLGNADESYYMHADAANILSKKGVDQALALSKKIKDHMEVDRYGIHTQVITSHYIRAKITAGIVMSDVNLKLPILHDVRLNEVYHSDQVIPQETPQVVRARVRSLIEQYPYHLILFCHGMLMRDIDPGHRQHPKNCELWKYDRETLLNYLSKN